MKMMTFFVVRILLIIGVTVAAQDGNVEPKSKKEFIPSIVQGGPATGHYQFHDDSVISALRGSGRHQLPGSVKNVSSDSPKLRGSLCDSCLACEDIAFIWPYCWPNRINCGAQCQYCC
ncbi:hypothetical protein FOZ60_010841 [Perkinsus olseni]|uniref:Uncharacterized protein n=1 Tax=Perkinsus olseni TaxID=32597 RepID=A0A7J6PDG2_PEROL|nr:hypothetical protein FOZ60_010841 [Perkinsus olseni]